MHNQIILGLLITLLPVFELRGGLPLILEYTSRNNISIWPYFALVLILNIGVIFLIFLFLDFLHESFMKLSFYRRFMSKYIKKSKKKGERLIKRIDKIGYTALALFVAVPLPGTGAWTGSLAAWVLGLDRKKSILAISIGVIMAGFIILFCSSGFFRLLG